VLRGGGVRAPADALVDRAVLLGDGRRLRVGAEQVRAGRGLDRRRHVQIRRHGEVDGRREVEPEVDVRVDVEQRHDLLVRERHRALRLDLVLGYAFELVAHRWLSLVIGQLSGVRFPKARCDKTQPFA
jgi:hypothetical protein